MATKVGLFSTKLYTINIASNGVSSSILRFTNTLFRIPYLCGNSMPYCVIIFKKLACVNVLYMCVCVMYVHPKFTPFYTKSMVKLEEFDKSAGCPIRERNLRRKSKTVAAGKVGLLVSCWRRIKKSVHRNIKVKTARCMLLGEKLNNKKSMHRGNK